MQNYATYTATGHDIDWAQVHQAGISFVFVKATDGQAGNETGDVNYDWMYRTNMENGHGAGLKMGPYHQAEPVQNIYDNQDAVKEANWFVDYAYSPSKLYATYGLPPALELTLQTCQGLFNDHWTSRNITDWVLTWMHVVEMKAGLVPVLYTSVECFTTKYFDLNDHLYGKSIAQYGVWIARDNTAKNSQSTPFENWNVNWGPQLSNNSWNYWQYSSQGSVSGIRGNVDLDYATNSPSTSDASQLAIMAAIARPGSFLMVAIAGLLATFLGQIVLKPYWLEKFENGSSVDLQGRIVQFVWLNRLWKLVRKAAKRLVSQCIALLAIIRSIR